jgi:hypothetical protein
MTEPIDRGLNFILEAIKVSPVAVLVVPMGLGLILLVAEQVRKEPRPRMLNTIWIYLGLCMFLSFMSVGYSWLNPSGKPSAALEYASRALDQQIEIYENYVKETPTEFYGVSPEVKAAWKRTEDTVIKLGQEACKGRNGLDRKIADIEGSQYRERSCTNYTPSGPLR